MRYADWLRYCSLKGLTEKGRLHLLIHEMRAARGLTDKR